MAQSKATAHEHAVHKAKSSLIMVRIGVGITILLLGLIVYFAM